MFQRALSGSGGGGSLKKIASFDNSNIVKTSTTFTVDLSNIPNASSFELFKTLFPVLTVASFGGGGGNIHIYYSWTYNPSTHILVLTISGDTGYISFNTNGFAGIDIYG